VIGRVSKLLLWSGIVVGGVGGMIAGAGLLRIDVPSGVQFFVIGAPLVIFAAVLLIIWALAWGRRGGRF